MPLRRSAALLATLLAFGLAGPALACCGGARAPAAPPSAAAAPIPFATQGAALVEAARWLGAHNPTGTVGPWCADFVSFVLRRVGLRPLAGRLAADALRYGPRLAGPQVGALAVMGTRRGWAGHVGFVEGIEADGSIVLLSGNWGGRVARSVAPRSAVTAFVAVGR